MKKKKIIWEAYCATLFGDMDLLTDLEADSEEEAFSKLVSRYGNNIREIYYLMPSEAVDEMLTRANLESSLHH